MAQKNIALSKTNLIICGIAVLLIISGFLLMTGPSTTLENGFEPDIFSARRIKLAPIVTVAGFVLMIVGILYPSKEKNSGKK
ncbi:MAG: DUF3098 domain-containing protein [Proteiniphilum sp.]|nr:DUF3098 domain-containing protein [Proteiniphilum sp.]